MKVYAGGSQAGTLTPNTEEGRTQEEDAFKKIYKYMLVLQLINTSDIFKIKK